MTTSPQLDLSIVALPTLNLSSLPSRKQTLAKQELAPTTQPNRTNSRVSKSLRSMLVSTCSITKSSTMEHSSLTVQRSNHGTMRPRMHLQHSGKLPHKCKQRFLQLCMPKRMPATSFTVINLLKITSLVSSKSYKTMQ